MGANAISKVLVNARVLTMDDASPVAEAVAVAGERIAWVGSNNGVHRLKSPDTQVIDCQGLTLLPGFNDAHLHLPGLARRLQDLDCGPSKAGSISELQESVREWAARRLMGAWVRGQGYDDLRLAEGRHPNRWELDAAAPDCPVWLEHRSGHAAVLNSLALQLAGINSETADPPGGLIERDICTGEPTGVLFEMRGFLRERLGSTRTQDEFEEGMRSAGKLLNEYGITTAQDAGADNGIERWLTFQTLQSRGLLSCRITMFAGVERLGELTEAGLSFGSGDSQLRLGHAKIMLTMTAGRLHPSVEQLRLLVSEAHRLDFPVAIHCIEEEAIAAAAEVLTACRQPGLSDRIEHCAEGTPEMVAAVRRAGAAVVTNPGFIYHNGAAYRENVAARLLPHLYPAGALHRAGATVAFGSDAPVIDPNPWAGICGAVTRRAVDGFPMLPGDNADQAVGVADALRMYTITAAEVEGTAADKGSIAPGKLADMVLVDADPLAVRSDDLLRTKAVMTMVGGEVTWSQM